MDASNYLDRFVDNENMGDGRLQLYICHLQKYQIDIMS